MIGMDGSPLMLFNGILGSAGAVACMVATPVYPLHKVWPSLMHTPLSGQPGALGFNAVTFQITSRGVTGFGGWLKFPVAVKCACEPLGTLVEAGLIVML